MRKVLLGAFIALVLLYGGCLALAAGEADGAYGTGEVDGADWAYGAGELTTADGSCFEQGPPAATETG